MLLLSYRCVWQASMNGPVKEFNIKYQTGGFPNELPDGDHRSLTFVPYFRFKTGPFIFPFFLDSRGSPPERLPKLLCFIMPWRTPTWLVGLSSWNNCAMHFPSNTLIPNTCWTEQTKALQRKPLKIELSNKYRVFFPAVENVLVYSFGDWEGRRLMTRRKMIFLTVENNFLLSETELLNIQRRRLIYCHPFW